MKDYIVVTQDNEKGVIRSTSTSDTGEAQALVHFKDLKPILIPVGLLKPEGDHRFLLSLTLSEIKRREKLSISDEQETLVVPVVEEELQVSKQAVEKSKVRIVKSVLEQQQAVDVELLEEKVDIQKVPINEIVETPASARHEGDTFIVPLHEEVLVIEKRLMLREELHITTHMATDRLVEEVPVRSEAVRVERIAEDDLQKKVSE